MRENMVGFSSTSGRCILKTKALSDGWSLANMEKIKLNDLPPHKCQNQAYKKYPLEMLRLVHDSFVNGRGTEKGIKKV